MSKCNMSRTVDVGLGHDLVHLGVGDVEVDASEDVGQVDRRDVTVLVSVQKVKLTAQG